MHTCTPIHTLAQIQVPGPCLYSQLKVTECKQQPEHCLQKHSCFYGFHEGPFPSFAPSTLCPLPKRSAPDILQSFLEAEGVSGTALQLSVWSQHQDCSAAAAFVYLLRLPEFIEMVIQLIITQLRLC